MAALSTGRMRMDLDVAGIDHQSFKIGCRDPLRQEAFPNTTISPAAKTAVRVLPIALVRRQIAPGRAGAQNPAYGIDEQAVIARFTTPCPCTTGQVGLRQAPDSLRNVVAAAGRQGHHS
jgi:hypothetical protein